MSKPRLATSGSFKPGTHVSPATEIKPGQHLSAATEIKPGQRLSEKTEIKPGQHLSVATEFRSGERAYNKLPLGTIRFRIDPAGKTRAWVKIAEPNVWQKRAIVVWESANGHKLPRGYIVHHKDRDGLNDIPDNLVALTRAQHIEEHRLEYARAILMKHGEI